MIYTKGACIVMYAVYNRVQYSTSYLSPEPEEHSQLNASLINGPIQLQ